jgi:hypothetical protein
LNEICQIATGACDQRNCFVSNCCYNEYKPTAIAKIEMGYSKHCTRQRNGGYMRDLRLTLELHSKPNDFFSHQKPLR